MITLNHEGTETGSDLSSLSWPRLLNNRSPEREPGYSMKKIPIAPLPRPWRQAEGNRSEERSYSATFSLTGISLK